MSTTSPQPTRMQISAISYWVANGGVSKAEAMRKVGYSEKTARNPKKVFGSPNVKELIEKTDKLDPEDALMVVNEALKKASRVDHHTFPPYNPEKAKEHAEKMAATHEDLTEKIRGEQMTDKEIREMYETLGMEILKIKHGEMVRHVWVASPDHKLRLDAAEKVINLFNLYPAKEIKKDVKHNHTFSLSNLRKKMRENNIRVTDPIIEADYQVVPQNELPEGA